MKHLWLTALMLGFLPSLAWTQPENEPREDRMRAQRIAVYTDVLKLSAEEAQAFWPIYNQFLEEREKAQKEARAIRRDNLSDQEAEAQLRKHFELRQRELDLEREMVQQLRKVIALQKIVKIPEAERLFRKSVLDSAKLREARQGKPKRQR
jgi:hypothetical protein